MTNLVSRSELLGRSYDGAESRSVVFVLDDDESVRRGLDRLLRSDGLDVECFASATELMARPLPARPACIVLDLRLPGGSGLEVQDELARAGWDSPVIFITGYGDAGSSVRALKAGAVDFLEKPVSDQTLLEIVHAALNRSRKARRQQSEREAIRARFDLLTPRERDVLRLVLRGLLNKQIASELGISEKTVKIHRGHVMGKTGVGSVAELVRQAERIRFDPTLGAQAS